MEKKSNKGLIVVLVIFIIATLCLGGYIAYDKFIVKEEVKEEKEDNETIQEEKKEETELTDNYIMTDITDKAYSLLTHSKIDDATKRSFKIPNIHLVYRENLLNMSQEDKQVVVLNQLFYEKKFENVGYSDDIIVSYKKVYSENFDNTNSNDMDKKYITETVKYISGEVFDKKYNSFFGEKGVKTSLKGQCPGYLYDKNLDLYYSMSECGGTAYPGILIYFNKYTLLGNKAYTYVSLGSIDYDYENDKNTIIYKDLIKEKDESLIYKSGLTIDDVKEFRIDNNNYHEFSKYKLEFIKGKDGIYYFNNMERVSK